jgi:hypothetical protein
MIRMPIVGHSPSLHIDSPAAEPPNVEQFDEPSGTFTVSGQAYGRGMPEPISVDEIEVTSSYGASAAPPLQSIPGRHPSMTQVSFTCALPLPEVGGLQKIFITVTYDSGPSITVERLLENFAYGPH